MMKTVESNRRCQSCLRLWPVASDNGKKRHAIGTGFSTILVCTDCHKVWQNCTGPTKKGHLIQQTLKFSYDEQTRTAVRQPIEQCAKCGNSIASPCWNAGLKKE